MTIGNEGSHHIDHKIEDTPMARVLDLRNVLELIDHSFHQGTLSKQDLVDQVHQAVLHVRLELGDQGYSKSLEQFFE
jgi:hypothetical protein